MTRKRKKWTKRKKKLTNPLIWKHNLVPQVIIISFTICMLFASFSTQYLHFILAKNISIWYSFPEYNRFIADAIDSQANKNLLQKHLWFYFIPKMRARLERIFAVEVNLFTLHCIPFPLGYSNIEQRSFFQIQQQFEHFCSILSIFKILTTKHFLENSTYACEMFPIHTDQAQKLNSSTNTWKYHV